MYLNDCSSKRIWIYALLRSAVVNIVLFIRVKATSTDSNGQLHIVSSIMLLKYRASNTFFNDSPFHRIITGFVNVFPVDNCSLFTGAIMSYFFNTSSSFWIISLECIGTLLHLCFLKLASFYIGKFTFVFPTSNFVFA